MKKLITALLGLSLCGVPAFAEPNLQRNSVEALGCMKLGECTKDVYKITTIKQLDEFFVEQWTDKNRKEIDELIKSSTAAGVELYLGPHRNFPVYHRGIYYTDANKMFLNMRYVADINVFIEVLRHEGWHAAQDCMAGSIDNSLIGIIHDPALIPENVKDITKLRYMDQRKAIPWEQEAIWAASIDGKTVEALNVCAAGNMWETYEPTPKTREWLTKNGYIK